MAVPWLLRKQCAQDAAPVFQQTPRQHSDRWGEAGKAAAAAAAAAGAERPAAGGEAAAWSGAAGQTAVRAGNRRSQMGPRPYSANVPPVYSSLPTKCIDWVALGVTKESRIISIEDGIAAGIFEIAVDSGFVDLCQPYNLLYFIF